MASIGTLAAGVAHEMNNPLAYVCSNLSFMERAWPSPRCPPEELPELREVLAETQEGIRRVRTIVQDLKTFARSDENRFGPVDVHHAIEGALRWCARSCSTAPSWSGRWSRCRRCTATKAAWDRCW